MRNFTESGIRAVCAVVAVAFTVANAIGDTAMCKKSSFDFKRAWDEVNEAAEKRLPRTVTNLLVNIEKEAVAASRWPCAARAFMQRVNAMDELRDAPKEEWLPQYAEAIAEAKERFSEGGLIETNDGYRGAARLKEKTVEEINAERAEREERRKRE